MKKSLTILKCIICIAVLITAIAMVVILFNQVYFEWFTAIDVDLASKFGEFFGGFIGTLFGFLSILLVTYSILKQTYENRRENVKSSFFRMIDYHYQNVNQIELPKGKNMEKGIRGFVAYKIQIKRLIQAVCKINHDHSLGLGGQDIASIAYVVFYYGLSESWKNFIEDKIQCYDCRQVIIDGLLELSQQNPELNLCRTNQTILSAYFRNMYNAIKLIDKEACFSDEEKKELIKIYRVQLSNPELYVLFFNIISPFGKKWVEQKYVVKYALLKNIPYNYLDGYNPKHFFDIVYEYEELTCSETFQYMEPPAIESATPLCVAEGERSKGRNKKKLCFCGFFCRISK